MFFGVSMASVFVLSLYGALAQLRRERREDQRKARIRREHEDVYNLYLELLDDPAMTRQKWLEWIPVFEFADRELAATGFYDTHKWIADLVRRELV